MNCAKTVQINVIFCCLLFCGAIAHAQTVAILDTGINITESLDVPNSLIVGQRCFSKADDAQFSNFISLCPNGGDRDVTAQSATIPRPFRLSPLHSNKYPVGIELEHGNQVSNALYNFDTSIKHKPVQTYFFEDRFKGSECLIDGGNELGCYNGIVGDRPVTMLNALEYLFRFDSNSISSVVITSNFVDPANRLSPNACSNGDGQQAVNALYNRGIAVVAALPNDDLSSTKKSWPNCLDNVINVGAGGRSDNVDIGIGANGIDFFAMDTSSLTSTGTVRGNSFAAPRVAAAMALLHNAKPSSTVTQKIAALTQANGTNTYKGVTRPFVRKANMNRAIQILTDQPVGPPPPVQDKIGYFDPTLYEGDRNEGQSDPNKNNHSFEFFLDAPVTPFNNDSAQDVSVQTQSSNTVVSGMRDVQLDFDANYSASIPGILATIEIYVNGELFVQMPHMYRNMGWMSHSYVISRNLLNAGNNEIGFRTRVRNNTFWKLKNIRAEYVDPIKLRLNKVDTKTYGNGIGSRKHLTGLRATFPSYDHNVNLVLQGWDIDTTDEIAVFLNQELKGYITKGRSSRYSSVDSFRLNKSDFVSSGLNTVELVQRAPGGSFSGFADEKWGVRNMLLERPKQSAALGGVMLLLLGDD